jgi:guanylate kinase
MITFLTVTLLLASLFSRATGLLPLTLLGTRQRETRNRLDFRTLTGQDLFQPRSSSSSSILQLPMSSSSSSSSISTVNSTTRKSLHPKIGDVVRYYDLDGGRPDGQVLLGRITYIFGSKGRYIVEVTELEDVKDGYYAEYSRSRRMAKKTERFLQEVSPVLASYVQSEQAYKIPMEQDPNSISNRLVPKVRQATYDLDDYEGPVAAVADPNILQQDQLKYQQLKLKLLKNSALVGLAGTVIASVVKGPEDAAIYFAGVVGSLLYLLFLSLKTDTIASPGSNGDNSQRQQLGSPISNLRFLMPILVLVGVSLYNQSRGDLNPMAGSDSIFDTVTQEQFGAAVLGFLTYRVPLFVGQIQDAFAESQESDDGATTLPGSAGVALKVLQSSPTTSDTDLSTSDVSDLVTILLVSGPQATGRSELVETLLSQDERLVAPKWLLRRDNGAVFERLQQRGEFLELDEAESCGLTKDSIFSAASAIGKVKDEIHNNRVVVVDASVDLAKKMQYLSGARLIGVWVGLPSVSAFEERIENDIANRKISIPEGETKESVIRARIKEIISEIEFGLGSGIFEFTILNEDPEQSIKELKQAASYAFK